MIDQEEWISKGLQIRPNEGIEVGKAAPDVSWATEVAQRVESEVEDKTIRSAKADTNGTEVDVASNAPLEVNGAKEAVEALVEALKPAVE